MPTRYTISFTREAEKQLTKLRKSQAKDFERVMITIESLASQPRPDGVKKLKGSNDDYRVRVGEYRVLYTISDREILIQVYRVGTRQGIY